MGETGSLFDPTREMHDELYFTMICLNAPRFRFFSLSSVLHLFSL